MRSFTRYAALTAMLLTACGGGSFEEDSKGRLVPGNPNELIRKPLEQSNAAIERAKRALSSRANVARPELIQSLTEAQGAIQELIKQQESLVDQLASGFEMTMKLHREKLELERQKSELERRERLLSTGFLAALLTALIAIAGVIGKYPSLRLDMQLKRLEIRERELKLKREEAASQRASNEA